MDAQQQPSLRVTGLVKMAMFSTSWGATMIISGITPEELQAARDAASQTLGKTQFCGGQG